MTGAVYALMTFNTHFATHNTQAICLNTEMITVFKPLAGVSSETISVLSGMISMSKTGITLFTEMEKLFIDFISVLMVSAILFKKTTALS